MELVEIISKETIKPSSPTPSHLRIHKLSLLDVLVPPVNIPVLLFYSASAENDTLTNPRKRSLQLKESLSKTLAQFYTFAGRFAADGASFVIDCNDEGVAFVEANVAIGMSAMYKEPEADVLRRLLPSNSSSPLAIQVNYFVCGGVAICVCVDHRAADASALASFLQSWATVACGGNVTETVTFDCTSLFPLHDLSGFFEGLEQNMNLIFRDDVVTKRFLFDSSKITALKDEVGNEIYCPTRVEAVSALIWKALSAHHEEMTPVYVATSVNLRKRMNSPLISRNCIGNVSQFTLTESLIGKTNSLSNLAGKIHDSIAKVDDNYVRMLHGDGGSFLNMMENAMKGFEKNWMFSFSSWCRFPFYETDFGWGKPVWFGTTLGLNRVAFFLDSKDGEGIEAWITLPSQEMVKFEQDVGILAYASFKPIPQNL